MERDAEIYWLAGFLEGEGCFGWYGEHRRGRPASRKKWLGYPLVAVSQNLASEDSAEGPWALHRVNSLFPGTIRFACYTESGKEHWDYRVTNEVAIDIMIAVFPLMSPRRQEKIKEVVANYAARAADRLQLELFCPSGHSRAEYGGRRKPGRAATGQWYCRECNRLIAARNAAAKRAEVMT